MYIFILIVLVSYLYFKTLHEVSFLKAQNWFEENSSLHNAQCEFCFAWKSRRSAWLSFYFIRIKPIGSRSFLCTKCSSILEINDIFSVKGHSYECHLYMPLYVSVWHQSLFPSYMTSKSWGRICYQNVFTDPIFFFKLSFFWELKYFLPSINLKSNEWSFFKTYPCAIFQKIGKDERSKAFVIAEDLLDRTDVGNSKSWIIYALWRGKKEWRIQREQVQKRIYSKFLRSGGKKLLRLKFSCQYVTEEGSKKHHSVINVKSILWAVWNYWSLFLTLSWPVSNGRIDDNNLIVHHTHKWYITQRIVADLLKYEFLFQLWATTVISM